MATVVAHHRSEIGAWEMVQGTPGVALRGHVRRYGGYAESTRVPIRRREVPSDVMPLILSFGDRIEVVDGRGHNAPHVSFVAGLHDAAALTEHAGSQHGVQVDVTPLAAGRLLGVPPGELTNQVVGLDDVLGRAASELIERLHDAASWEARFALLDAVLAARLAATAPPPREVVHAWRRLTDSHGRIGLQELAVETGWSRRHLGARFREHVGLPPKVFARVLRFGRAAAVLERGDGMRLAEIALDCGYYDQAHLNRDFRAFSGVTPTELLAARLPDGGGVAAGQIASVQDGSALTA